MSRQTTTTAILNAHEANSYQPAQGIHIGIGTRVSYLTGTSKDNSLQCHTGQVTGYEETPIGNSGELYITAYCINPSDGGEELTVNSGRVRVLDAVTITL